MFFFSFPALHLGFCHLYVFCFFVFNLGIINTQWNVQILKEQFDEFWQMHTPNTLNHHTLKMQNISLTQKAPSALLPEATIGLISSSAD